MLAAGSIHEGILWPSCVSSVLACGHAQHATNWGGGDFARGTIFFCFFLHIDASALQGSAIFPAPGRGVFHMSALCGCATRGACSQCMLLSADTLLLAACCLCALSAATTPKPSITTATATLLLLLSLPLHPHPHPHPRAHTRTHAVYLYPKYGGGGGSPTNAK
jgi:hypothetical protein